METIDEKRRRQSRESHKRNYWNRRRDGRCVRCGNAAMPERALCSKCEAFIKEKAKLRYRQKHNSTGRKVLTDEEREEHAKEYRKKYRDRHKEERAAKSKALYAKRKTMGLCVMCGNPVESGHVTCCACREFIAKKRRALQRRQANEPV